TLAAHHPVGLEPRALSGGQLRGGLPESLESPLEILGRDHCRGSSSRAGGRRPDDPRAHCASPGSRGQHVSFPTSIPALRNPASNPPVSPRKFFPVQPCALPVIPTLPAATPSTGQRLHLPPATLVGASGGAPQGAGFPALVEKAALFSPGSRPELWRERPPPAHPLLGEICSSRLRCRCRRLAGLLADRGISDPAPDDQRVDRYGRRTLVARRSVWVASDAGPGHPAAVPSRGTFELPGSPSPAPLSCRKPDHLCCGARPGHPPVRKKRRQAGQHPQHNGSLWCRGLHAQILLSRSERTQAFRDSLGLDARFLFGGAGGTLALVQPGSTLFFRPFLHPSLRGLHYCDPILCMHNCPSSVSGNVAPAV